MNAKNTEIMIDLRLGLVLNGDFRGNSHLVTREVIVGHILCATAAGLYFSPLRKAYLFFCVGGQQEALATNADFRSAVS